VSARANLTALATPSVRFWAMEAKDLSRPHPQVKIPGRGGKLPGTYQGRRGPRPLRGAVNGPGAVSCCHLHPSGVAAGHESLISKNAGNRCANRRSRRSRSTVEVEVVCSRGVQLCAVVASFDRRRSAHLVHVLIHTGSSNEGQNTAVTRGASPWSTSPDPGHSGWRQCARRLDHRGRRQRVHHSPLGHPRPRLPVVQRPDRPTGSGRRPQPGRARSSPCRIKPTCHEQDERLDQNNTLVNLVRATCEGNDRQRAGSQQETRPRQRSRRSGRLLSRRHANAPVSSNWRAHQQRL
jgi:hypothetical protein